MVGSDHFYKGKADKIVFRNVTFSIGPVRSFLRISTDGVRSPFSSLVRFHGCPPTEGWMRIRSGSACEPGLGAG